MRETLYLRLGAAPDAEVEFGVATSDLRSLQALRGSLRDAAGQAQGRRVVVFLPATETQLATVEIPGRINARLMQAVPYALEDQLAEDVETLHFAVGERMDDGRLPVVVISHELLQQWLDAMADVGLRPDVLVPEVLALPQAEDVAATLLSSAQSVTVRMSGHGGFVCDESDLDSYLELEQIEADANLLVYTAGQSRRDWSTRGPSTRLMPAPSALHVLANALKPSAINLLQGPYSERQGLAKQFIPWRLAASLFLGWLLLTAVGMGVQASKLGTELERIDRSNVERYQQIFPEEKRIADLETQLEQKIRGLSGDSHDGPLALLDSISRALSDTPTLKLEALQFRDGAIYVSLSAANLQALESLRAWYAKQGDATLEVQSANAEAQGAKIRARVSPT